MRNIIIYKRSFMQEDQIIVTEKWAFNKEVAACFANMLERSIPQYDIMRDLTFKVANPFVKHGTDIIDIGCSTGLALEPFIATYGALTRFIGIEVSEPMVEQAIEKFSGYINLKPKIVNIINHDIKKGLPDYAMPSVVLSILTIQFVPIEYRMGIIQDIYDKLLIGGAFIFVEKVIGGSAKIDKVLVENYLSLKKDNGYSEEQILRKKASLEGVLVPVTAKWNEELLKIAGFKQVDCFWRCFNFAGWLAIK